MSKRKYIITSFVIVLSFFLLNVVIIKLKTNTQEVFFSTPEEAIKEQLLSTDYTMVESNGVFFAVCNTEVNDYACQYIMNSNEGWRVVTDDMFKKLLFDKRDKDGKYEIYIREYADKYMIYISQNVFSEKENGVVSVKDSLNSEFVEMDCNYLIDEHYWFLCLDSLPQQYSITINEEVVFENRRLLNGFYK